MNKRFLKLLVVILFLVFSTAEGADWILYGESSSGTYYYDKQGMTQLSGNIRQVWIRNVLTSVGVKNLTKKSPAVKDAGKIRINMLLTEVDCSAKQFRILKGTSYDSSGHKITSFDYIKAGEAKWEVIIAGSSTEMLSKALCK